MSQPTTGDRAKEAQAALVFFASQLEHHFVHGAENLQIARELCAPIAAHIRALLAVGEADTKRLDWLENAANGEPIEVDSFTCVTDEPACFLTVYPATGESICDQSGCKNAHIAQQKSVRIGKGASLRAALDAAMGKEGATDGE